jgi:hypothetical protein
MLNKDDGRVMKAMAIPMVINTCKLFRLLAMTTINEAAA